MKKESPIIGKAGKKTSFAKVTKGSQKHVSNPKSIKFSTKQFHDKKGKV